MVKNSAPPLVCPLTRALGLQEGVRAPEGVAQTAYFALADPLYLAPAMQAAAEVPARVVLDWVLE